MPTKFGTDFFPPAGLLSFVGAALALVADGALPLGLAASVGWQATTPAPAAQSRTALMMWLRMDPPVVMLLQAEHGKSDVIVG
ncbi:hypothetical protein GCM10010503_37630 [Streptomyces lucensis JCM 4490]|uniref:Uncharacterized protein n=1 Tax=Streptomyces lucensis JCM 4490 TaxID=1306176 RepID=A0A918J7Y2_9ACTN|nr:hypothetical protein GCM10010503_37630 [Streptomyces lucensis JCM 4490]